MCARLLAVSIAAATWFFGSAAVAGCPPQTRDCVDFGLVSGVAQQIVSKEPTAAAAKWVPPSDEPYTGPMVGVAKTVIRAPTIGYRWALE
jgi:hypothetical protein